MANERRNGNGRNGKSAGNGRTPSREGTSSEEALERTLAALGPLLRRRAGVPAPRPAFVVALRVRLLAERLAALDPAGAGRAIGRQAPGGPPTRPGYPLRRGVAGIVLAAVVLVALAVAAVGLGWPAAGPVVLVVLAVALTALIVGRRRR